MKEANPPVQPEELRRPILLHPKEAQRRVDYLPILNVPGTTAPLSFPTNVAAQTGPTTIALAWDANLESEIAGYEVHYDTNAAVHPYANSTDMSNVNSCTLTGLSTGATYYTAVSAYGSGSDEPWVSADLSATTLNTQPTATGSSASLRNTPTYAGSSPTSTAWNVCLDLSVLKSRARIPLATGQA